MSSKSTTTRAFGSGDRVNHDSSAFYNRKMYTKSEETPQEPVEERVPPYLDCILLGDAAERMTELPPNSIHLLVTSPPYNVGKEYDEDLTLAEYRILLWRVFLEAYRVLVPGGRAAINVAGVGRKPYIPLQAIVTDMMLQLGFLMRGEIIWQKALSPGGSCAWGSWCSAKNPTLRDVHEYILVFSKDRLDRPTRGKSTITKEEFLEYTSSVWRFNPESATRVGHPAPFPVELPRRLIKLYTYEGDIVLDPFMGSGTTAVAAKELGRHFIGYDIKQEYIDLAYRRLEEIGR